jgi:hypothetical protein
MKKITLLTLPVMVLIVIGVILLYLKTNQQPGWQDELSQYLRYKSESVNEIYDIHAYAKGKTPWNLHMENNKVSLGESEYYQTDFRYGEELSEDEVTFIIGKSPDNNLIPLPFPPNEVWCVLLKRVNGAETNFPDDDVATLVLVALHQDLYNADYVVHEIRSEIQDETSYEIAEELGCALP